MTTTQRENYQAPAMANGMIGILPNAQPLGVQKIILNGVYDRYGTWGDGIENIVQGINFLNLNIAGVDTTVSEWKQELNMKEATLATTFTYGGKLQVTYTICALRQLPYNGLMMVHLKALQDVSITVSDTFGGSESARLTQTRFQKIERTLPLASATAISPTGKVQLAAAVCFTAPGCDVKGGAPGGAPKGAGNGCYFQKDLKSGETFDFALNGAICTTAQFPDPINESKRLALAAHLQGVDKLLEKHKEEWAKLWTSDIQIEGDTEAQKDVRFALFNLYSFVRQGTAYALSPMGLSETGYNGHVFWDCETWMYPVFLLMHPEMARSILDYRYNRLGKAMQNAQINGYKGAMFPWESAGDGTEETPVWALTGPFEQHISSDIGMAYWNYFRVTKDVQWLREKGFPVIRGIADFWVSRTEKNEKGEYEIKNVVCADEYAENVDNNAFTNGGAIIVLRDATLAAEALNEQPNPSWRTVADHIPIRYGKDSVVKEFDTYKGQTIKQADVNLLSYPLHLVPSRKVDKINLAYYEPRVDQKDGPAMTYGIFSVISSRLGDPDQAWTYFNQAYKPNQRPPYGVLAETPTENNPYFATGAGAMLQAVIYGFGGLDVSDNGIVQWKTKLPKQWKKLTITGVGPDHKTFTVQ